VGISGSIGSDDLFRLASLLEPSYFLRSRWAMAFPVYAAIKSLRSSAGQLVFPPESDTDGNPTLMGRRVAISPSMPTSIVVLGDLKRLIARQAGNLLLSVSTEKRPEYGQLYVRGMFRVQAAASINHSSSPVDAPFVALQSAGMAVAETKSSPPAKEGGREPP
jgi:HK97 family phage major capsid protein